jgi:putative cardiolipin synthase
VPVEALATSRPGADDVARAKRAIASAGDDGSVPVAEAARLARAFVDGRFDATWARGRVLVDSPHKVDPLRDDGARQIADELVPALASVSRELVIVSPYVIPDDPAMAAIGAACSRGARVVVLTNSLATNDMLLAHAGYASKRGALLDTCVELHELKAQALPFRGGGGSLKASSGSRTSLHVKALVLDRRYVFLTSLNLDPRSLHLNTEIGLWIDSPPIADAILRRVDEAIAPSNSYRVVRDERGSIAWVTQRDGVERRHDDEPDTTAAQRLRAKLAQLLPIEREL